MLGLTDLTPASAEATPVERTSSRVQAVVTLATPFDMTEQSFDKPLSARATVNLIGSAPDRNSAGQPVLQGSYAEASPITYVTPDDAPILMYHAEDDPMIPMVNATRMSARLREAKVPSQLIMRDGGGHRPRFDADEIDRWFLLHLRR